MRECVTVCEFVNVCMFKGIHDTDLATIKKKSCDIIENGFLPQIIQSITFKAFPVYI